MYESKLTIISDPYFKRYQNKNRRFVLCKCICGNKIEVLLTYINNGNTRSCGCLRKELLINRNKNNTKHKLSNHILYTIWTTMKQRCYNSNHMNYHRYGGRGIKVCEEWLYNFKKFYDWSIINGWTDGLTIERKDTNGNYCPENCIFTTMLEQSNNKSNNRILEIFNEKRTIAQWSRDNRCQTKYETFRKRIQDNWNPEKALTTPSRKDKNGQKV